MGQILIKFSCSIYSATEQDATRRLRPYDLYKHTYFAVDVHVYRRLILDLASHLRRNIELTENTNTAFTSRRKGYTNGRFFPTSYNNFSLVSGPADLAITSASNNPAGFKSIKNTQQTPNVFLIPKTRSMVLD